MLRTSRAPVGTRNPRPRVQPVQAPAPSGHGQKTAHKRALAYKYLSQGFTIEDVVTHAGLSRPSVYRLHRNVLTFGSMLKPRLRVFGRPSKFTSADKQAPYDELAAHGWMFQDEMVHWLDVERGIHVF